MLTLLSLDMETWYNKEPEEEHTGSMTSGDRCHLFSVKFDAKNEELIKHHADELQVMCFEKGAKAPH